ncbi:MAG: glycosyltransferase family 39 protein [Anaerolineae bacterium]|nr:glycosyltransferase family 39 protein [Anaerolineae bacterium]
MKLSKTQIVLCVALLLSNAIILYANPDWPWLRLPAAWALTFVLPGWAWLPRWQWLHTNEGVERIVLIGGFSLTLSSLALLITVLLPGPFTETPVIVTLNLVTLAGLVLQLPILGGNEESKAKAEAKQPNQSTDYPTNQHPNQPTTQLSLHWPSRTVLLILIAIVAVGAFTRLTRLGYAEFHEDELENMRLIVRAYKGEEYVPFIDSKGPIHWLLPAALWYTNGWINEGIARTPFALASLLLIPTMYMLGRRISNGREHVGLIAAGIVVLNGFFASLARHVENRSLIVFWGALAVWLAYRYYREERPSLLIFLALTLSVGLIAHPTVLLYLPVIAFIIIAKLWCDGLTRQQVLWLMGGLAVFAGVTALFYVPYLTSPEIERTIEYFAEERVGTSFLYNRVGNMLGEDKLYSSRFYGPILILLLAWLLVRHFARMGRGGMVAIAVLGAAIISTVLLPDMWIAGIVNLAFIPYLLLTLGLLALPRTDFETKVAFLWFAAPFGALLFLATDASNHIQIAYPGWAMLCAFALDDVWAVLSRRDPATQRLSPLNAVLRGAIVAVLAICIPLIVFYQYLSFGARVTTYWQAKIDFTDNPHSLYKYVYDSIARPRRAISNPRLGGWKAVGELWENGTLSGDFRSVNESFAIPIWYTFQTPRSCYNDPQNYWLRRDWQGWPDAEQDILAEGYTLTRIVLVDQQPKLHLYEKNAQAREPEVLDMEQVRHDFDRLATPARFAAADAIENPASLNFGDKLLLRGYNLPEVAQPGNLLPVTVYWEALAPMDTRYRAFVHLVDSQGNRWGQHDEDPACRLITNEMRPGQESSRQFRVAVDPATPPGVYQIILGVYHPDTLERLDIWDNQAQQSPGNSVILGEVQVAGY